MQGHPPKKKKKERKNELGEEKKLEDLHYQISRLIGKVN